MQSQFCINTRKIGPEYPVYIIAEMSANHNHDFDQAVALIKAAKDAGADAVKLQTYTPDTMTLDCDNEYFRIGKGTIWEGKNLYSLYGEAYTPWEWQPELMRIAKGVGLDLFSTPFDPTSVDFLESMEVPAYKIASFEIIDLPLIRRVARTGKPVIISTGMATVSEIAEAVETVRGEGNNQIALLKCTSEYPARVEDMNLRTIPHLSQMFHVPVGLSDHTLGISAAVASVALGATIIEKHFTLSRKIPGPDSVFSLEPHEFRNLVDAVRETEKSLGTVQYACTGKEEASRVFRRSLFAIKDIRQGEAFTVDNVRSIRPGYGVPPKYIDLILGKPAKCDIKKGTPLNFDLI